MPRHAPHGESMRLKRCMLSLVLALAAASAPVAALDLSGTLTLYAAGQPLRASEAAEAVIYFRTRAPMVLTPAPQPFVLSTRRKQFVPRVLAVTAGSVVRFPNEDPILHNVFSTSPNNAFDAGLYGTGDGAEHVFAQPGLVKVYCNVHHSMFAYILVLDTPYFTRADATGRFTLRDLPDAADGEIVVFHDRGQPLRQRVQAGPDTPALALRLDLDKRKVPAHMNKFGKPYGRPANAAGY
jgi:plastocyanin